MFIHTNYKKLNRRPQITGKAWVALEEDNITTAQYENCPYTYCKCSQICTYSRISIINHGQDSGGDKLTQF